MRVIVLLLTVAGVCSGMPLGALFDAGLLCASETWLLLLVCLRDAMRVLSAPEPPCMYQVADVAGRRCTLSGASTYACG
jgi:hypothetical protein